MGASVKIVELNQGVCTGKEIAYFVKIYPSDASPSWVSHPDFHVTTLKLINHDKMWFDKNF